MNETSALNPLLGNRKLPWKLAALTFCAGTLIGVGTTVHAATPDSEAALNQTIQKTAEKVSHQKSVSSEEVVSFLRSYASDLLNVAKESADDSSFVERFSSLLEQIRLEEHFSSASVQEVQTYLVNLISSEKDFFSTQPVNEQEKAEFLAVFDQFSSNGFANEAQWKPIFQELFDESGMEELYFRGLDVQKSGAISRSQFETFTEDVLSGDLLAAFRILFQAFDADQDGRLTAENLLAIERLSGGSQVTLPALQQYIERINGDSAAGLDFSQSLLLLKGVELPVSRA